MFLWVYLSPSSSSQRVSVVDMDEEGINELLNSHGLFKADPEPESDPDPVEQSEDEDVKEEL